MRLIFTQNVGEEIRDLFLTSAFVLHPQVKSDLVEALRTEPSPIGRSILNTLLLNSDLSAKNFLPLCQDTGLAQVRIDIGQEVVLAGPPLAEIVDDGVRSAYNSAFLRKSTCWPTSRHNLGDNCPASLETVIVPGEKLVIRVLAKGGGCDNRSQFRSLSPTAEHKDIVRAVVEAISQAGPDACPPYYAGVSLGGSFESAPRLSRLALMEILEEPQATEEERLLADEILATVNASGVGPMGLGGRSTLLGVRVKVTPTHLASLPLAVNLSCHSFRCARVEL
ncbi:MAG: fumarate hydratase [Deltaproteobacteria bacterium]|jgi:fumarate hydratase subunit alpha|nr:fumarate hydratase [Deltaproteobacteria bacterium]